MAKISKENKEKLIAIGLEKINKTSKLSWKEIGQLFGIAAEDARQIVKAHRYSKKEVKGRYEKGRFSMIILSDLHVPDHDEEFILNTIEKHKNVDVIVLNGDIIDCKAVSSFDNEGISILDKELLETYWLLKQIRKITKAKIVLVKGNHEHRVNREYAKKAKNLGTALVETEILYKLANGFTITFGEVGEKIEYKPIKDVDYVNARSFVYGDLLVNHPSSFSKIPMRTVTNMYEQRFKYKYPEAKVVVIGHTHQAGMVYRDDGTILIEQGCSCFNMSYAEQDDKPYGAQQRGYVYLEMKDKKVDLETVRLFNRGPARNKFETELYDLDKGAIKPKEYIDEDDLVEVEDIY